MFLIAFYLFYLQTNIPSIFSDSVNYNLLLLVSYVLFLVNFSISGFFGGMVVVLLDESWVAGKLSEFSSEVKTKTTIVDKFKLRFETVFLVSTFVAINFFLVTQYRNRTSNTPIPSNCFLSIFKIAIERDQLSKLSWSISRLLWTTSETD